MRLLLFYAVLACAQAHAQGKWDLKLNRDSIQVYTRHTDKSKFKAVKADFRLNCSMKELEATVLDITTYKYWQYNTVEARMVNQVSDREIIYYTRIAAPMFTSDRDLVIRLFVDKHSDGKGMTITALTLPGLVPPVKGVVRVPYSIAHWKVTELQKRRLSVEYTVELDLGGAVPPWLVNLVAPQAPYETFFALRSVVAGKK